MQMKDLLQATQRVVATCIATIVTMLPISVLAIGQLAAAQPPGVSEKKSANDTARKLPTDLRTRRFGEDWPVFLGKSQDSKSTETGIITDWSKKGDKNGLEVKWQIPLRQSYGTCTTSRGRVFQFDSEPIGSPRRGESTGRVLCLNSETGKELWRYEYNYNYADQYGYNNGPRTSPIVDGNRVYVYGVDGRLACLRVEDGDEVWVVDTNKQFGVVQNFFGVGSNPVIADDLVLVMVGGSPAGNGRIDTAKGNGSGIVAFNKLTGDIEYKFSDELASYASLQLVARQNRSWCFAFMRGGLLGFDPKTGKEDFMFPWRAKILESVNASVPVVFGNNVFISETYGPGSALLDFSTIRSGKSANSTQQANLPRVVWQDKQRSRSKAMQTHWNTAIYHDGYLYGSSGRHQQNAELRCIEAKTGKLMWSHPGLARCSLLYVDKHLICLSEVGITLLLEANPKKYTEVGRLNLRHEGGPMLRSPAWAAPVLSHGLLYLRGDDRLVCLELIPPK